MRRLGMALGLVGAPALVCVVACSAPPSTSDGVGATVDAGIHVKPGPGDAGGVTAKDAGASDAAVAKDSGAASYDAGGTPGVCPTPEDMSGFAPSMPKLARLPTQACTSGQISGYYTNCVGPSSTSSTCTAWESDYSNQVCANCVDSDEAASSWGPLVRGMNGVFTNQAGCVELLAGENPAPKGSCAYDLQATFDCETRACDFICPVSDDASFQLYDECVQSAATGTCKAYEDAVGQTCQEDAGTYARCFAGATFEDTLLDIVPVFCGG